jgi:hypothetical protein
VLKGLSLTAFRSLLTAFRSRFHCTCRKVPLYCKADIFSDRFFAGALESYRHRIIVIHENVPSLDVFQNINGFSLVAALRAFAALRVCSFHIDVA